MSLIISGFPVPPVVDVNLRRGPILDDGGAVPGHPAVAHDHQLNDSDPDWHNMNQIVKHFHLAFKGIDTPEIYDILMGHLVATIKGYDPAYTEKVKLLVEVIENELSTRKQFSFADVNRHLDFDCNRYIRLLGRLGFLSSAPQLPKTLAEGRAGPGVCYRTWSSKQSKSLPIAMARASSFSNACWGWSKFTVMRPGSSRTPSGRFSNFC